MAQEENGLTARVVLDRTYDLLGRRHSKNEIVFPRRALAVIGDDSDWHRNRTGYMGYERVRIIELDGKRFILGRGEKCGDYPGNEFGSDMIAIATTPPETLEHIKCMIGEGWDFMNSLVIAMAAIGGGQIVFPRNGRGSMLAELMAPEFPEYCVQLPAYAQGVFLPSTMGPPATSSARYKPEIVEVLAGSIEDVLKKG